MSTRKSSTRHKSNLKRPGGLNSDQSSLKGEPSLQSPTVHSAADTRLPRSNWDPMDGSSQVEDTMSLSDAESVDFPGPTLSASKGPMQLVPAGKRQGRSSTEHPHFGTSAEQKSTDRNGPKYFPEEEEPAQVPGKYLDANTLYGCHFGGVDIRGFAGSFIVTDRDVNPPWTAARNDVHDINASKQRAVLDSGPRHWSVEAFKHMYDVDARNNGAQGQQRQQPSR